MCRCYRLLNDNDEPARILSFGGTDSGMDRVPHISRRVCLSLESIPDTQTYLKFSFLIGLDAVPMVLAMVALAVLSPGKLLTVMDCLLFSTVDKA